MAESVYGNLNHYAKTDAWKTAVALGKNQLAVLTDIGKEDFNARFRTCPVVRYSLKTTVHSVYVRTSPVPVGMNAYDYFTENWRSTDNVLGRDFELYDSLDKARAKQGQWGYCNYDDWGVGYPRDCGKTGWVGNRWFAMPTSSRFGRVARITGSSFALYTGARCPSPLSAVWTKHENLYCDSYAYRGNNWFSEANVDAALQRCADDPGCRGIGEWHCGDGQYRYCGKAGWGLQNYNAVGECTWEKPDQ